MHDVCQAKSVPVWCGGMLESGIGRAHNIAMSSLENFSLPGDVSASRRYWQEDIIEPEVEVSRQGTIRVPDWAGHRIRAAARPHRGADQAPRGAGITLQPISTPGTSGTADTSVSGAESSSVAVACADPSERSASQQPSRFLLGTVLGGILLLWCFNYTAGKIALRHMDPFSLASIRTEVAALLMLAIHFARRERSRFRRRDLWTFTYLGFFGVVLNQGCFSCGFELHHVGTLGSVGRARTHHDLGAGALHGARGAYARENHRHGGRLRRGPAARN